MYNAAVEGLAPSRGGGARTEYTAVGVLLVGVESGR